MKKKKVMATAGVIAMATSIAGCSGGSTGGDEAASLLSGTIEIIVPAAAGGSTDVAARLLAQGMEDALGQTVVVVNRDGGSGVTGASFVAGAAPDGSTLLFTGDGILLRSVVEETPFAISDFRTIGGFSESPYVVFANPGSSWGEAADLEGANVRYAASGIGTLPQTMIGSFLAELGAEGTNVPYDGSAPAMQAVLGGNDELGIGEVQISEQFIQEGDLVALAVSSPERFDSISDVPTFDELGLADSVFNVTFGLVAPVETPDGVIAELQTALAEAMERPEAVEFIENGRLTMLEDDAFSEWLDTVQDKQDRYAATIESLGTFD